MHSIDNDRSDSYAFIGVLVQACCVPAQVMEDWLMEYRSKLAEAAGMGEAAPADAQGVQPKRHWFASYGTGTKSNCKHYADVPTCLLP